MVPELLLNAVWRCSGTSISASERNNIATKNWHVILVKKDKVFSVFYS